MKKKCLICNSFFLDFLDLGHHPCADTFLNDKLKSQNLKKTRLKVGFCKCSHLTTVYPVNSHERYEKYDYSYTSSNSPISRYHFKNIANIISKNYLIKKNSFVVEAGSNDGTFLREIKRFYKCNVLGIDPSKNMCEIAKKKGIESISTYFNSQTSKTIIKKYGHADILYGANVFNHVDDNLSFLDAANIILKPGGMLVLEVPDLDSLIKKVGFDTIYHEHRHYYSIKSISKILKLKNFYIKKFYKINYMAGSLRVFAFKSNKKIKQIKYKSIVDLKDFKIFKKKVSIITTEINKFVDQSIVQGTKIYGVGAATKGNTLLNCCHLNSNKIEAILDNSKYKIGKYTPGSAIKIINEKKIKKIEKGIILPWNITTYLVNKLFKNKKNSYISIARIVKKI